jgi:hypothetical protein
MNWDWDHFFAEIEDQDLFLIRTENNQDYSDSFVNSTYLGKIQTPENLVYFERSGYFFELNIGKEIISIDKTFLIYFFKDYLIKSNFLISSGSKKEFYFGFEFMLNLNLSKDTLSGLGHYKVLLNELRMRLSKGSICIEGNIINNQLELENYLKRKIIGFISFENEDALIR